MLNRLPFVFTAALLVTSSLVAAAPPDRAHADEYVSALLDADHAQHAQAAARLAAVNERDGLPVEVERRLVAYLRQSPTPEPARAELIRQITAVLANSNPGSPAITEIVDGLSLALLQQPLPVARRGAAEALFMISRHTMLPERARAGLEAHAFADPDREVRIAAIRTLIQTGPNDALKRRLHEVLMAQAAMTNAEFAAPDSWNYDARRDKNAVLALLWNLHEPHVPASVMSLWVSKLVDADLHDTARRMLDNVVQQGAYPAPIYSQLLAVAESDSPTIDAARREQLYRLLQRSRLAQAAAGTSAVVDDLALATTFARDLDIGKRRTAGHLLREFANDNRPAHEALELVAEVAEHERDRELRQLALRIIGYAAPEEYVDVLHRYFGSGRYDHLTLRIFLASYGREAWVRRYGNDPGILPKVRAAAIYDYSRSGFAVPDDMIDLLQAIAADDQTYEVRQAAGQALRYLDAWVPLRTRLERQENQQQMLFMVWLAAVGVYPLSLLLGLFFLIVRWSRVRAHYSVVGIVAWAAVALVLIPAIGIAALSLFRHNGPTPTSREMFFTFLPTYLLVVYFAYSALQLARAGLSGPRG